MCTEDDPFGESARVLYVAGQSFDQDEIHFAERKDKKEYKERKHGH